MKPPEFERPVLDLSGEILRAAMQTMVVGSEEHGGIERYIDAVKLKSQMFRQALVDSDVAELDLETFKGLCAFMATVRRRVSSWLNEDAFVEMRVRIVDLFDEKEHIDERIGRFCDYFPNDKKHRWVRDLAAELLHNADPERVPMMNRWVWDARANTGVIREIWHGDNVDSMTTSCSTSMCCARRFMPSTFVSRVAHTCVPTLRRRKTRCSTRAACWDSTACSPATAALG